jgi:hypothetical protein
MGWTIDAWADRSSPISSKYTFVGTPSECVGAGVRKLQSLLTNSPKRHAYRLAMRNKGKHPACCKASKRVPRK